MANSSVYTDIIKYLDKLSQDSTIVGTSHNKALAIDRASVDILQAKQYSDAKFVTSAIRTLMGADLVDEADQVFFMWMQG